MKKGSTTRWVYNQSFVTTSDSGHSLIADAPAVFGGNESTQTPMEMVLSAAASCAGVDVTLVMKKQRKPLSFLEIQVEAEQAETEPKVYTHIHFTFICKGSNLTGKALDKALALTFEKHCPVSIMLARSGTQVSWEYQIISH
ncbi:OsmC family protein [Vibrio sp.]|nr:OsmC family protein [Vibrio sp.]